jgi:hypothetical protein
MDYPVIKDSGERREFTTGAVRDMSAGKGRFDLLCPFALARLAEHMERGSVKYGDRNWEQGIPQSSFMDSAMRHLNRYAQGQTDEEHLLAALWNVHCMVSQQERVKAGLLPAELLNFPPARASQDTGSTVDSMTKLETIDYCDAVAGEGVYPCHRRGIYCLCGTDECKALLKRLAN